MTSSSFSLDVYKRQILVGLLDKESGGPGKQTDFIVNNCLSHRHMDNPPQNVIKETFF